MPANAESRPETAAITAAMPNPSIYAHLKERQEREQRLAILTRQMEVSAALEAIAESIGRISALLDRLNGSLVAASRLDSANGLPSGSLADHWPTG